MPAIVWSGLSSTVIFPSRARALPRVGDAFRLDYEVIVALEPDLILGWESGTPANVLARLRELGYRVVALEPSGLDSIADHLRYIGTRGRYRNRGEHGCDEIRGAVGTIARPLSKCSEHQCLLSDIGAPGVDRQSAPRGSVRAIGLCGGRNVFCGSERADSGRVRGGCP